jgi:hypothetical protein
LGVEKWNEMYELELELEFTVDWGVCEFVMKEKSDSAGKIAL